MNAEEGKVPKMQLSHLPCSQVQKKTKKHEALSNLKAVVLTGALDF